MRVRLRDWTNKDAVYAGATAVAALVVVFLMAGNFGLVPSPFATAGPDLVSAPEVPTLAVSSAQAPTQQADGGIGAIVPAFETSQQVAPRSEPSPAPTVQIATADRSVIVRLTEEAVVTGTGTHLERVIVTFEPTLLGEPTAVQAALDCGPSSNCTWLAPVPSALGAFTVSVQAFGADGQGAVAGPITITVVDLPLGSDGSSEGGAVGEVLEGAGDAVGSLVTGLTGVVGGLTGGLGGALSALLGS